MLHKESGNKTNKNGSSSPSGSEMRNEYSTEIIVKKTQTLNIPFLYFYKS